MENATPLPKEKMNITAFVAAMVVVFLGTSIIVLAGLAINIYGNKFVNFNKKIVSIMEVPVTTEPTPLLLDTDRDSIPDIYEVKLGLDPKTSELVRCNPAECNPYGEIVPPQNKGNILFIIDSSAGMNKKIDGIKKIEVVRQAIQNFLKQKPSSVNIGILIYGNKGTEDIADKAESCMSTQLLSPMSGMNSNSMEQLLSGIKPAGWTPLSLGIRKGIDVFKGKEGQKNQMIVITDSTDGCNVNPVDAASAAHDSPYKIRVDIATFAVNISKQSPLMEASVNTGGSFWATEHENQLSSQILDSYTQFQTLQDVRDCRDISYRKSVACLDEVLKKINILDVNLAKKIQLEFTQKKGEWKKSVQ